MAAKWTKEEEAIVLAMRAEGFTVREIAAKLRSRSEASVRMRLNILEVVLYPVWTEEEKQKLAELKAQGHTNAYIAKVLGRTVSAVKTYVSKHWHKTIPQKNNA